VGCPLILCYYFFFCCKPLVFILLPREWYPFSFYTKMFRRPLFSVPFFSYPLSPQPCANAPPAHSTLRLASSFFPTVPSSPFFFHFLWSLPLLNLTFLAQFSPQDLDGRSSYCTFYWLGLVFPHQNLSKFRYLRRPLYGEIPIYSFPVPSRVSSFSIFFFPQSLITLFFPMNSVSLHPFSFRRDSRPEVLFWSLLPSPQTVKFSIISFFFPLIFGPFLMICSPIMSLFLSLLRIVRENDFLRRGSGISFFFLKRPLF